MAFSEFCDDVVKGEAPERFEGGNNKQRTKLNKLVKFAENVRDSCLRRGGDDGGGGIIAGQPEVFLVNDGGETVEWRWVAERV